MNEFGIVILCIMGIGTLSIILNIYLAYHINRLERENEDLRGKMALLWVRKGLEESDAK